MSKKRLPSARIIFITSDGAAGAFDPWNQHALNQMGIGPGAIDPRTWSYHIQDQVYEIPGRARKGHECGGSINVLGEYTNTGETIEFSHIFYIDTTGHGGNPDHWNHEVWIRKGTTPFTQFDKSKTVFHKIPISDWIEIQYVDHKGNIKSKKIHRP